MLVQLTCGFVSFSTYFRCDSLRRTSSLSSPPPDHSVRYTARVQAAPCSYAIHDDILSNRLVIGMSGDDLFDRLAEIDFKSLVAGDFKTSRVESKQLHDRGVDIGHIVRMLVGVKTNLVRRSVSNATL